MEKNFMTEQFITDHVKAGHTKADHTPTKQTLASGIQAVKLPYANFNRARQQIAGILAIDYYFAKELSKTIRLSQTSDDFNQVSFFHLLLALSESLREGHSCLPLKSLADRCFGFACDIDNVITHHGFTFSDLEQLTGMFASVDLSPEKLEAIVFHQDKLYLRRYFNFEYELSLAINNRLTQTSALSVQTITNCVQQLFPQTAVQDSAQANVKANVKAEVKEIDWQKIAVANALNKNFSVIAGGPGTGKTYTVTKLLAALVLLHQQEHHQEQHHQEQKGQQLNIALVAPTGKAAQRLSESIGNTVQQFRSLIPDIVLDDIPTQAQTIHRLLGVIPNNPNFRHHQDNLLAVDVLLIDEVSMVDLALLTRVFRALPAHCKVILLGDADQLPSVAAGSVLSDIAPRPHPGYSRENTQYLAEVSKCEIFARKQLEAKKNAKQAPADHITYLTKSRRFDDHGGIGKIANAVIKGQSSESWQLLVDAKSTDVESTVIESDISIGKAFDEQDQLSLLTSEPVSWLPPLVNRYYLPLFSSSDVGNAFKLLSRFRILCATRKGDYGVENINELVKNYFVEQGLISSSANLYHAKPIMISENDYRLGLYNGDIGLIWRNDAGHLMAVFEDMSNKSIKNQNAEPANIQTNEQSYKWIMPSRLPSYESVYAMTIHKTQGSEFEHVAMILPTQTDNKLLSRELLYTGITRAKKMLSISSNSGVWHHGVEAKVQRDSGFSIA